MEALSEALKEWAIALEALLAGDQILLLRKGGLREEKGRFGVRAKRVLLFPTYEHQQPGLVKPHYQTRVQPVESGYHPTEVTIAGWADITHSIPLGQDSHVLALAPFHVWHEQFVQERWAWQPSRPLYLLLLRSHRLPHPISVPYQAAYGGCRSWITLADPLLLEGSEAVLTEMTYQERVDEILAAIGMAGQITFQNSRS